MRESCGCGKTSTRTREVVFRLSNNLNSTLMFKSTYLSSELEVNTVDSSQDPSSSASLVCGGESCDYEKKTSSQGKREQNTKRSQPLPILLTLLLTLLKLPFTTSSCPPPLGPANGWFAKVLDGRIQVNFLNCFVLSVLLKTTPNPTNVNKP